MNPTVELVLKHKKRQYEKIRIFKTAYQLSPVMVEKPLRTL